MLLINLHMLSRALNNYCVEYGGIFNGSRIGKYFSENIKYTYLAWVERAKYVRLSLSLSPVSIRTHSLHCRLGLEKLNTTLCLLPTVCKDTRVLSRALAALGLLQLGSCVCVSKDLWFVRSLPPFYVLVRCTKTQNAANIKIFGYLEHT